MILSFCNNLLFVKTRKTAGTSIEIALSLHCSKSDVITPISPVDEILRKKLNGLMPRNFSYNRDMENSYRKDIIIEDIGRIDSSRKLVEEVQIYWNHMPIKSIKPNVPKQLWKNLFKFTIDRHPYEKAVSQAYFQYTHLHHPKPEFNVFLDTVVKRGLYRNFDLYSDSNGLIVDVVLKFENLPECLTIVEERTGIEIINKLPVTKNNFRKDRRPADEILTSSQKGFIKRHCRQEFELLNY